VLRVRLRHRFIVFGHRVAQGQDAGRGSLDQEHPDRRGAEPSAGQDPLLGAGGGCDPERYRGLQSQEWTRGPRRSGCTRTGELRGWMGVLLRSGQRLGEPAMYEESLMITLSETAAKEIRNIVTQEELDPEKIRLRVGVKGGGCSGFSYLLDLTESTKDTDEVF